eukprot:g156.t1
MADDAWMKRVCGLARRGDEGRCIVELTSRKVSAATIYVEKRPLLHFAVQSGNSGLVTNLLNFGCDPNSKGPFGETPLSIAARTGDHGMVELLASRGADLNTRDGHGKTCMDHLAARGDSDKLLLRLQRATGLVLCRLGCGSVMPPSELAAHEMSLCENAIVACPYCHQVMSTADFRDQHDCPEEPVQCGMCKKWHPTKDALKHEMECQLTFKYKCEICNSMVLFCKKIDHLRHGCMERIVECPRGCGETFAAKDRPAHLLEACPKRVVDCPQCDKALEFEQLRMHMVTSCPARPTMCRFGCINVRADRLQEHEEAHLDKDLLLFTPAELAWWIELNEDFRGDPQLRFRVLQCFLGHAYTKKHFPMGRLTKFNDISAQVSSPGKNAKRLLTQPGGGGPISGRLLSSMWRSKIKNLLCDDNDIDRPFCKRLLDKLGTSLRTTCPRGCGVPMFPLDDRKEHADFCALGVAKCLRCGKSVVRKHLKGDHRKVCEGRPGMRRWPVRQIRKVRGEAIALGETSSQDGSSVGKRTVGICEQRPQHEGEAMPALSSLSASDESASDLSLASGVVSGGSALPEI